MKIDENSQYQDLVATKLYCSHCGTSMPVLERLLLILPDGYLYEYICKGCGEVIGDKKATLSQEDRLLF